MNSVEKVMATRRAHLMYALAAELTEDARRSGDKHLAFTARLLADFASGLAGVDLGMTRREVEIHSEAYRGTARKIIALTAKHVGLDLGGTN